MIKLFKKALNQTTENTRRTPTIIELRAAKSIEFKRHLQVRVQKFLFFEFGKND